MKKLLPLLLVLVLMVCLLSFQANAATEGDFKYLVYAGKATITDYTGSGGDVTIPSTLGGYPVTSIGEDAFYYCTSLTSVTIGDSVTSIGNDAFQNCYSLTSVTIGDSVTSIGRGAFYCCTSLTSVTIPDSVTSIGMEAFYNCSSLTFVTIGNSVTAIGNYTFNGCTSLTSVTIPDSVTSIGDDAFSGCSSLTSVTIGNSVTAIGGDAFFNCGRLISINIPDSVTSIGNCAFEACGGLTSVTIPDSVTSIGGWTFAGCWSLTSIAIPVSVTSIGDNVFFRCSSLTDVYYAGTQSQWNTIDIHSYNDHLLSTTIHYNHVHDYTATTVNPTCTQDGYTEYTCVCSGKHTEVLPASEHNMITVPGVEPTCTEPGKTAGTICQYCDTIGDAQTTLSSLGHSYVEQADKSSICSGCGDTIAAPPEEVTPANTAPSQTEPQNSVENDRQEKRLPIALIILIAGLVAALLGFLLTRTKKPKSDQTPPTQNSLAQSQNSLDQ